MFLVFKCIFISNSFLDNAYELVEKDTDSEDPDADYEPSNDMIKLKDFQEEEEEEQEEEQEEDQGETTPKRGRVKRDDKAKKPMKQVKPKKNRTKETKGKTPIVKKGTGKKAKKIKEVIELSGDESDQNHQLLEKTLLTDDEEKANDDEMATDGNEQDDTTTKVSNAKQKSKKKDQKKNENKNTQKVILTETPEQDGRKLRSKSGCSTQRFVIPAYSLYINIY